MLQPKDGVVPINTLAREAGLTTDTLRVAIRDGLLHPTPIRRRSNTRTVTVEDALLVLAVAALAVAAGVAFCALLRVVRETGAEVRSDGIVIPLPVNTTDTLAAA